MAKEKFERPVKVRMRQFAGTNWSRWTMVRRRFDGQRSPIFGDFKAYDQIGRRAGRKKRVDITISDGFTLSMRRMPVTMPTSTLPRVHA